KHQVLKGLLTKDSTTLPVEAHGALPAHLKIRQSHADLLRCPACGGTLAVEGDSLVCEGKCGARYPIVGGVPLLINEANSIFTIADVAQNRNNYVHAASPVKRAISRLVPDISLNTAAPGNYRKFGKLLLSRADAPRV